MPQPPAKQFSGIFVCYRRDDTDYVVDRLVLALKQRFGKDRIFVDVDSIRMGKNFRTVIEEALSSSEILIAMIGRSWLAVTDKKGRRRLDDPNDSVRVEITSALKRNITVIPIKVYGASMPSAEDLPDDLAELALRNAVDLSRRYWDQDVDRLLGTMEEIFAELDEADQIEDRPVTPEPVPDAMPETVSTDHERQPGGQAPADIETPPIASSPKRVGIFGAKAPIWIGAVVSLLVVIVLVAVWLALQNKTADERLGAAAPAASSPKPAGSPTPAASPTPSASPKPSPAPSHNPRDNTNKNPGSVDERRKAHEAAVRQKCAVWQLDHDGPCPYK